jgi:hypothetical protein
VWIDGHCAGARTTACDGKPALSRDLFFTQEQLRFEPNVETRNRKPLRQPAPFGAEWEIRFGPDNRFRVLYDIDKEQHAVQIMAIGEKVGTRLIVGGEEVEL